MLYYCSGSELFYQSIMGHVYLYINLLLHINLYVMLTLAKLYFPSPDSKMKKLMFIGSSFSSQAFMSIPLWIRLYEYLCHDDPGPISNRALLWNHVVYILTLIATGFFFASLLPERGCPGGYDIFGHSHQIFHSLSLFMSLWQLKAGYMDLISQPVKVLSQMDPTFASTIGGYLFILSSGLIFLFIMRNQMRDIVKKSVC